MNNKFISQIFLVLLLNTVAIQANNIVGTVAQATAIAIQSNGKPVIAGFAESCDHQQILTARFNADGTDDGTYNGTGYALTLFGGSSAANSVLIQSSDQKIVVSGYSDDSIAIVRYLSSGALDTNFGSGGRVNFELGSSEVADSMLIQSTGKLIIAGGTTLNGAQQFLVARFNTTGTLDTTFGSNGYTLTAIGEGAVANGVGLQVSSGKIILAGTAVINGQPVFATARYNVGGSLDLTFGTSGVVTTAIGVNAVVNAVAVDSSNRIVVVGTAVINSLNVLAITRYTANGTLDNSFGTGGIVTIDIPTADPDQAYGVAIQNDGKIVLCGTSQGRVLVLRLNNNGSLDTSGFGAPNGYVTTSVGSSASGLSLVIQPSDQRILVSGFSDINALVIRYNTDGTLDTTWNTTGITTDPSGDPAALCGTCNVCPTGATGAVGTASLASYGYLFSNPFSLSLSSSSTTPVPFNTEGPLLNITHSTSVNPDQISLVDAGVYKITAVINLSSTTSGVVFALYQNGSPVSGASYALGTTGTTVVQAIVNANASDVIQLIETGLLSTSINGNVSITIEQIA